MPTSPDSSATPACQLQDADERAAWLVRVQALASAADGITQASDQWDTVSDSYCDKDGWPVDETGYADGKVARDAAAWEHVETFLTHCPEVLAGVRAAAQPADYLDGPISADLLRLPGIDSVLERAGEIRREWDQVIALREGSRPGSLELYEERAREIRNSEGWHYADELSYSEAALARAADHLTDRIAVDQSARTGRVQAAPGPIRLRPARSLCHFAASLGGVGPPCRTPLALAALAPTTGEAKPPDHRILNERHNPHRPPPSCGFPPSTAGDGRPRRSPHAPRSDPGHPPTRGHTHHCAHQRTLRPGSRRWHVGA
ncbi:hypothetical protein [Streptomyces sp. NPDC056291]|uniref:hypothetical protein n=1 Tax=Streptomyces sp. NPDC056291 TaxID=3345772 RepID=UPI0035E1A0B8